MSDVTKQRALVTGATSGLGLEAAAQFGAAGYREVVVTGRTGDKAETARDGLRSTHRVEITGVDRPTQLGDDPVQHNPLGTP